MLHEILRPVRQRLWLAAMIRGATFGFLAGTAAALMVAIVRLAAAPTLHWGWPIAIACAGGLLGWLVGACQRRGNQAAARLVDEHYVLKDRSITALQFVDEDEPDSIRQLQISEAQEQLKNVDPAKCVPLNASAAHLRWVSGLAAALIAVLLIGGWFAPEVEAKSTLPLAKTQASELRETMLPELEQLAEEQKDPELEKLLEELENQIEEMDSEPLDEMDLMATLSEMEQSLAEAREALQLDLTDTMMKSLASAMKPSDVMKQAAEAMEAEKYDEASKELAKIDPSEMGDKQRRAVADNLKKMVSKLQPGQQGELSESISQLAEGLEAKDVTECKKCLAKLAKACDKQGECKKIGKCMSCQLNRLAQCKNNCISQCNNVAKSNSPSKSAGAGASGKPLGETSTEIDSVRNQEKLSGAQSDGPSETEILQAPEGEQQAVRQYTARYNKFKREAEAVLNSEPLPMGHRETVRTYFEAIRPNTDTDAEVAESIAEPE